MPDDSIGSPLAWAGFIAFVLALLALDLGVFHRKSHAVSWKEAAVWSGVWASLALLFNGLVYRAFGAERALEFGTGYLIEKALSVDNVFVFLVIFRAFGVRAEQQHRVLFWGVLGAIAMRALVIVIGGALLARFHWVLYAFGALLVLAGFKLFRGQAELDPQRNPLVRGVRRWLPIATEATGDHFFVRRAGRVLGTPLLIALVAVEATDLLFAVDSIPAVFAVTEDPFIVFTSNIFAILGLRSLYFLLAGVIEKFTYLKQGLALVLVFVGAKMLLAELYHIPIAISLGVIVLILGGAIAASLWVARARRTSPPRSGFSPEPQPRLSRNQSGSC
jgi:tellurite resistance protein TerC